ncbi:PBCV-specific basic adaptor domain-containing protein [Paramecium bursaria Chlorella virus CvsA1]|nr:PBCV-specific basic adaptor domain-containing protein [Paramecium bursaria Chlorella virus CvsA1]
MKKYVYTVMGKAKLSYAENYEALDRINRHGRQVYKDSKGKLFVKEDGYKVFVRKTFPKQDYTMRFNSPVRKSSTPNAPREKFSYTTKYEKLDRRDKYGRQVYRDSNGRLFAREGDYKVFLKSPTPMVRTPRVPTPATAEIEKVNAKGRRVFRDTKGRTFVKQDGKKVYVKKLFTPKSTTSPITTLMRKIGGVKTDKAPRATSPVVNTGKVDAKKRKVFKNSKGRTHVKQDGKKVYVKKLFTPKAV